MKKINVSIVGATGFTGAELLRVLIAHPNVDLIHLASRQHEKTPIGEVFPRLQHLNLNITNPDYATVAKDSDVVFLCLPHVASQEIIDAFLGKTKIIDMSADFRLDDEAIFEKYYKTKHLKPHLLKGDFVYGLPELNQNAIQTAQNIANPGCNALLVQLMLLPFAGHIKNADVFLLTGTTGGGRSPRDPIDHPALAQNVRSYEINTHRHTPEIIRTAKISAEQLNFVPTVGPFLRGIFATAFVRARKPADTSIYKNAPFVRLVKKVELSNIVSTNFMDVSYASNHQGDYIVQGAIDNLLRGAAGTAVQNMNLMFGLDQTTALKFTSAIYP